MIRWPISHPPMQNRDLVSFVYRYHALLVCVVAVLGLMTVSLLSLESTAMGTNELWLTTQGTAFAIGWSVAILIVIMARPWRWQITPYLLYASALVILLSVFFIGVSVSGHKSWLHIGPFSFQPSEWAKVALAVILAFRLAHHERQLSKNRRVFFELSFFISLIALLVLAQGDLGSALIIVSTLLPCLVWVPFSKKVVLGLAVIALLGGGFSYQFFLSPYQKTRIHSFLHPEADSKGSGYQVTQSKITIGSGQWLGKGFKHGTHHRLRYLPARHSDFIFCVWAEEWGFLGASVLLFFYFLLLVGLYLLAEQALYREGQLLAAFAFWQILVHLTVNLGGVLGLLPLTGVPLPLVSYGGSAILSTFILLGLAATTARAPVRLAATPLML